MTTLLTLIMFACNNNKKNETKKITIIILTEIMTKRCDNKLISCLFIDKYKKRDKLFKIKNNLKFV